MNHIYRVVYNTASQTYQAVPEISKGKHKSCAEKTSAAASKTPTFAGKLRALCAALLALTCPFALAVPTGGAVSAGQAAIHQAGNITDIRQSSQNAAINWQNFSIGAHETVNFHQPNAQSLTLNRVIGNERSIIDGAMNANGKVFISNPNGMLIGRDAQINVGSLVATTAQISNDDFMNGRYQFTNAKGEIENLGNITVPQGGVVALIAPIVKHSGTITAPKAHTLLASADSFSITLPDNANFAYTLDKGTLQGLVDNGGAILADGGRVVLTAKGVDSVKKSLIKHTGVIEANTVQNNNGVIELLGDLDNSALNVSGSLKAEAKGADKGGFVETSASQVKIHDSAVVSTKSEQGQTGTWLIDPKDLIIANSGGDMTATQVENALKTNNIALHTIRNTQGKNDGKGDIKINDAIRWNANTLTLNAENDIHINANLNGSGTAKLALEYGQGSKDGKYKAVVDGKETTLDNDYYLDKNTPLKDRTVKVNLPEGKNFSVKKGSNGEVLEFNVIHQMPDIIKNTNGDWESKFTTHNIAFGKDIDVGFTKNYEGFAGWQLNGEWGRVAGLGHTVKGLSLHSKKFAQHTGLFQDQNGSGYLRDIGVIDVNVRSDGKNSETGGLVGIGRGISNSYATGDVSSTGENADAGGLAGHGTGISNSYATGDVSSTGVDAYTGGLVGNGSHISNSYATGDVSSTGENADTGGLAGVGYYISNSYATGNVSSAGENADTGGLAGIGNDTSNSYATGNVSSAGANANTGGLMGRRDGWRPSISNSYATGDVSSTGERAYTGGLVGEGTSISNSYATGNVSSAGEYADAGGLVGRAGYISNSYATGNVSSTGERAHTGGLAGWGFNISNSYANNTSIKATGKDSTMAGLIGNYYYSTGPNDSFFNQDKHPTLPAIGKYEYKVDKSKIVNVAGKTEGQLKERATFKDWDFEKVWYMNKNADGTYSYPMLRAFAQTLTVNPTPTPPTAQTTAGVKAPDLSKTYDGKAVNTVDDLKKLNGWKDNFDADGLTTGDSVDGIFKAGTLTIDETKGDWKGAKDVKEGGYSLYPTGTLKDEYQQKYIIEWNKGVLTINKKPITIAANSYYDGTDTAKIYDKNDKFFGKQIMGFNGIVKGDDVSLKLGAAGTLNSNQAGNTTLKDLGNLALEGASANNYTINKDGSTWTINKRPIKVTGSREYNGSEWVNGADLNIDKSDIVGKDQILLNVYTGDAKLDGKDTKNGRKIVDTSKIYFGGKDGENYEIDKSRSSVDITPKNISVEVSKEYDGTNEFTKGFKIKGIIDGENPNIHISKATVAGKDNISNDVDYDKFTSISIAMPDKNYKFENGKNNVVARILPKTIVITPKGSYEKHYYQKNPKFEFSHTDLIGNDKIQGELSAYINENNFLNLIDKEKNVGKYSLTFKLNNLNTSQNYKLLLGKTDSTLQIKPLPLKIKAHNQEYQPDFYNPIQGVGALSWGFDEYGYDIIRPKNNFDYPDYIPKKGQVGIENGDKLRFLTPKPGQYRILKTHYLDIHYPNYQIEFEPGIYTVKKQKYIPIISEIRDLSYAIEGIGTFAAEEALNDIGDSLETIKVQVDNIFSNIDWGNAPNAAIAVVSGVGIIGLEGIGTVGRGGSDYLVYMVKGVGSFIIDESNNWSQEQKDDYTKKFHTAIDLIKLVYDVKKGVQDIGDNIKSSKNIEHEMYQMLISKHSFTGVEARNYIKYLRDSGKINKMFRINNLKQIKSGSELLYNIVNGMPNI